jgi:hypothetical protein
MQCIDKPLGIHPDPRFSQLQLYLNTYREHDASAARGRRKAVRELRVQFRTRAAGVSMRPDLEEARKLARGSVSARIAPLRVALLASGLPCPPCIAPGAPGLIVAALRA